MEAEVPMAQTRAKKSNDSGTGRASEETLGSETLILISLQWIWASGLYNYIRLRLHYLMPPCGVFPVAGGSGGSSRLKGSLGML